MEQEAGKTRAYGVAVRSAEPDEGGFWAEVEELPGCFASGETLDEVENHVRDAIATYLLALAARGEPSPEGRGSVGRKGRAPLGDSGCRRATSLEVVHGDADEQV